MFPYAIGTFSFKDRDETVYSDEFLNALKEEFNRLKRVGLTSDELEYMSVNCRFMPRVYWEWLSSFRFNPEIIEVYLDEERHLHIEVTDYLYKVTLYEVPILAIVSEIKNMFFNQKPLIEEVLAKLATKVELSNSNFMPFSEFGTRRRFSFEVHDWVVDYLKEHSKYCTGTSNCYLAMKYNMRPMGTHPHEWFMFHGAQFGYKHANYMALENWVNVYDGDLGTALSDTYTSESFLTNFSRKQAKLFDGVRCDSGDELEFVDKLIDRYKELGIDPVTKTIIFSNALDFEKALSLGSEDEHYAWSYFVDFEIVDVDKGRIGRVTAVDESTVNVLFEVQTDEGDELLIPASEDLIDDIDHQKRIIYMTLPEGLLSLDEMA